MGSQDASSEDMLHLENSSSRNSQPKQIAAYARNWRCPSCKTAIVCPFIFIIIVVVAVPASLCRSRCDCPSPAPIGPACPPEWIGYLGTCYYLSREERNWTSSQNFCTSQNASLAKIEKTEEKDFVNLFKLKNTYWIGLKRGPGQPWKWTNGENATLAVLGDGGDCAFLNDEAKASSSRCGTEHHWMCSKADALQNPMLNCLKTAGS